MMSNEYLIYWIPKLADIFVFTYPVYLLALYGYGMFSKKLKAEGWKLSRIYYKKSAMYIFVSMWVAILTNIVIQLIVDKARPDVLLWLIDNKTESILHKFLPAGSFPSDHAALSMAIAMATLMWWIKKKDKRYTYFSIVLFIFSIIMSMSRITAAIHWPTDIIVGILVGLWIPWILMNKKIYKILDKLFGWIGRII